MKAALLYGSRHGKTRRVAAKVVERLCIKPDVFNVKEPIGKDILAEYDLLIFFCPTYGDEELQEDMELFLSTFELDMTGKKFVICELGNYYGYDDFHFGVMSIIRCHLVNMKGEQLCESLSLDSNPRTNWGHLERWVEVLNQKIENHDRH